MSLMLHCGAEAIDRDNLNTVLPERALGARHYPLPYGEYVDQVQESIEHHGYRIQEEQYGVLRDGGQFFGLMEIQPIPTGAQQIIAANEYGLMVGLRGSYDQSLPRGLAIGSRVFVCDNLAFSGEVNFHTKQTTNIRRRLPRLIGGAVNQLVDMSHIQDNRFAKYKEVEMQPRWGDAAIVECVRRKVINPSQVGKVIEEWDTPTHEEHLTDGRRTLWTFHNAVTEAIKPAKDRPAVLLNQPRTIRMTQFLDEVAGL